MKKLLFSAMMLLFVGSVFALNNTPEQNARQKTDMLAKKIEMTPAEDKQVYDIYLNHFTQLDGIIHLKSENTADTFMAQFKDIEEATTEALNEVVGEKLEAYKQERIQKSQDQIQKSQDQIINDRKQKQ